MSEGQSASKELEAMQLVHKALADISQEGRQRVVNYIVSLFKLDSVNADPDETPRSTENPSAAPTARRFESLADLYDAAAPATNAEKALVVGVWLQDNLGNDSFSSQTVNSELKHLGHGVANITAALEQLKDLKPAYIQQLRKSGASQQARKTYKVTLAGVRAVSTMIERANSAG